MSDQEEWKIEIQRVCIPPLSNKMQLNTTPFDFLWRDFLLKLRTGFE